jgi:hypothetical protein
VELFSFKSNFKKKKKKDERRKKKSTRVGWNIIYWDRPRDQHEISPPKKVLTTG